MSSTMFSKHLRNSEIAFNFCTKYGGYYRIISGDVFDENPPTMRISQRNDTFFSSKFNSTENESGIPFSLLVNGTNHIECTFLKSDPRCTETAMIRVENVDSSIFSDDLIGGIMVIAQNQEKNWVGVILDVEDDIERFQSFFNLKFSDTDGVIEPTLGEYNF
nr:hypothetical protein [uncultured Methanospirillum sp.]